MTEDKRRGPKPGSGAFKRQTTIRLGADEEKALDELVQRWGLAGRRAQSEAIRRAIRETAKRKG